MILLKQHRVPRLTAAICAVALALSACSDPSEPREVATKPAPAAVAAAEPAPATSALATEATEPSVATTPVVALVTLPLGKQAPAGYTDQLSRWRNAGDIAEVTLLEHQADAQPEGETPLFASLAILRFADETAYDRWSRNAAPSLGANVSVRRADQIVQSVNPVRDSRAAVFVVNHYEALVPLDAYTSYTNDYIVPNMDNQKQSGVMSAYTMYLEREPAGTHSKAVLVKEYLDHGAFARSDAIKDAHKEVLLQDPKWKQINDTKTTIRTDLSETVATQTLP